MKNPFESQETPLTEQEVIEVFDREDIDSPAAVELYEKYVAQCRAEADYKSMEHTGYGSMSRRANVVYEVKIALVYARSQKYKTRGIDKLNEVWESVWESGEDEDLRNEIVDTLEELQKPPEGL